MDFDSILGALASLAAVATYAGSLLDALAWRAEGSTGSRSPLPYAMLLVNAAGWLAYGLLAGLPAVVIPNALGLFLASLLCASFASLSPSALPMFGAAGLYAALVGLAAFSGLASPEALGTLCSGVAIAMFASPLATLRLVLQTRSAESLPAPMILLGLVCTSLWTLYGLRLGNPFMYGPNGIAMVLGLAQLALLITFPSNKKAVLP